jgi:hypothetical protein
MYRQLLECEHGGKNQQWLTPAKYFGCRRGPAGWEAWGLHSESITPKKSARKRVNATSKEMLCISITFASALFGYSGVTREHDVIIDRGEVRKRKKGCPSSLPMSLDTQFCLRTEEGMTMLTMSAILAALLLSSPSAVDSSAACKPVKHYAVSGCELLPNQTCPRGYHKRPVGPSSPQMKSPTYLMCVPDKPSSKEQPPNKQKQESQAK